MFTLFSRDKKNSPLDKGVLKNIFKIIGRFYYRTMWIMLHPSLLLRLTALRCRF